MNREDFKIFDNYKAKHGMPLTYLDNASTSLTPSVVVDAMSDYYNNYKSNIDRGLYANEEYSTAKYEESRSKVADFIGADKDEVIFTSGSTMSSNMLISMLEKYFNKTKLKNINVENINKIILSRYTHNSELLPLQEYASRNNIEIVFLENVNDMDEYKKVLEDADESVLVISLPLVSNVTGEVFNIKEYFEIAKSKNILTICDMTSGVSKINIDVKEMHIDAAYFSAHKMMGPSGVGVIYVNRELLRNLSPVIYGGGMVAEVEDKKSYYRSDVKAYEAGTNNIPGVIALGVTINYINNIGVSNIKENVNNLTKYAYDKLSKISELKIYVDMNNNSGIISFNIKNIHSHDVAEYLASMHVCVRSGHMCAPILMKKLGVNSVVRVSINFYNTTEDIDRLIVGINKCIEKFA